MVSIVYIFLFYKLYKTFYSRLFYIVLDTELKVGIKFIMITDYVNMYNSNILTYC